ncbi:DUF1048 domain-containing protein [Actinoallomurus purpureus]|uniref:DUF1048 domain-containing protein n=1 Tax=Actinoallomurus purpureus TaxID=478114 RepID=UPI0020933393|nr:DUF1048 domain-containing protein [Actinoallomurus purpureus]MCO6004917.1 DUF1048 domain-containing protein [Actinoallomurus purpureus]
MPLRAPSCAGCLPPKPPSRSPAALGWWTSARTAVDAIERYLMHFVPADGDSVASEFEDLADLFEQAAADGKPIREIVGDDPVEFVEAFAQNYTKGGYVPDREPKRLINTVERAAGEDTGRDGMVR